MARWPATLRWRLTLWYTVLLGIPLIGAAAGCYALFESALYDRTDRFINDALSAFSREVGAERRAAAGIATALRTTTDEVRFRDLQIAILDSAGQVVAVTPPSSGANADRRPAAGGNGWIVGALAGRDLSVPQAITVWRPDTRYRVVGRPLDAAGHRFELTGTYGLTDIDGVLGRIRGVFVLVIPLLMLCAAIGGYFLATRSLEPVAAMGARAAEISAANLQERLPVSGSQELAGLARVVNGLLDRLEASFALQRRFMADASHELRTPTAILRTEADVTLSQPHRAEGEYRESVSVMRDAAARLTRIVDDLFLLTRADAGHLVPRREALDLDDVVYEAARSVRPLAAERGVHVQAHAAPDAPFEGDADLLGRLLLNLLDNAIKYSPAGGTVDVALDQRDHRYEVRVVDAGEGIPAEARERVFERFFRVDVARARGEVATSSGAGLGLAIARRIAELHGGQLDLVESRPGRTEFRLRLPAEGSQRII